MLGIQIYRDSIRQPIINLIGAIQFRTFTGSGANYQSSAAIEVYAEDTHGLRVIAQDASYSTQLPTEAHHRLSGCKSTARGGCWLERQVLELTLTMRCFF